MVVVVGSAKDPKIKGSVYKLALVTRMISARGVAEAFRILEFCERRVSGVVAKVLRAAVANAQNNGGFDADKLYVKEVRVGKALTLRRMHARARGRGSRIAKRYSRVEILLGEHVQQ